MEYKRNNDTVIILGTASTLGATPWNQENTDFWGCAPVITYPACKKEKVSLLFEMHKGEYFLQTDVLKRLNESKIPIMMQNKIDSIPMSIKYPLEEIQIMVGNSKMRRFFTSSISYMIALAIFYGYKFIELYGVHMSAEEEQYSMQRNACEAWLAYALGKGCDFSVVEESDIFKVPYMYAYEQEKDVLLNIINFKEGLLSGQIELDKKIKTMNDDMQQQIGAIKMCDQLIQKFK